MQHKIFFALVRSLIPSRRLLCGARSVFVSAFWRWSLRRWLGGDWANTWHLTKLLLSSFGGGGSYTPSYLQIFLFIAFLQEAFLRNMIIRLWVNYTVINIMCINNKEVIDYNYGRLQQVTLVFKISIGTRTNIFKIHRQFGRTPSNWVRQLWCRSSIQEQRKTKRVKEGHLDDTTGRHVTRNACTPLSELPAPSSLWSLFDIDFVSRIIYV
jgi:hypothetical protein